MNLSKSIILALFQVVTRAILRIHAGELTRVPQKGPLILVTNHVNILEIPVIYECLQPRQVHGLVLASRWKNPVLAWGLNACGALPLGRGEVNMETLHQALSSLEKDEIIVIAPEGTRSGNGKLQKGRAGVVVLGLRSGAPLLPVVFHGSENYKKNVKHLRRSDFYFSVGRPFRLTGEESTLTHELRQQILDEIMYQLAATLPEQNRGQYTHLDQASVEHLEFIEPDK